MTKLDDKIVDILSEFDSAVQGAANGYSVSYFDSDIGTAHDFIELFMDNGKEIVRKGNELLKFSNAEIRSAIDSFQ